MIQLSSRVMVHPHKQSEARTRAPPLTTAPHPIQLFAFPRRSSAFPPHHRPGTAGRARGSEPANVSNHSFPHAFPLWALSPGRSVCAGCRVRARACALSLFPLGCRHPLATALSQGEREEGSSLARRALWGLARLGPERPPLALGAGVAVALPDLAPALLEPGSRQQPGGAVFAHRVGV